MRRCLSLLFVLMMACTSSTETTPPASTGTSSAGDPYLLERLEMVERQIADRGVTDPTVLEALRATPRHLFVLEDWLDDAYADHPLPIGYGQTISQPYIVGLMSESLGLERGDRVLEIGTGSGYQAAVLAEMGMHVYTVEIISELAERAGLSLEENGYPSVRVREGDGYWGWPEAAPFDGIIVTAAPDHIPQPLVDQLAPDGAMVIPIGPIGAVQTLWKFTLGEDGGLAAENLGPVRFVPFTRASST